MGPSSDRDDLESAMTNWLDRDLSRIVHYAREFILLVKIILAILALAGVGFMIVQTIWLVAR